MTRRDGEDARLDAAFLMTIGAMITLLCGACTLSQWDAPTSYGLAPIVGGLPTAGGVAMFVVGLWRFLRNREP